MTRAIITGWIGAVCLTGSAAASTPQTDTVGARTDQSSGTFAYKLDIYSMAASGVTLDLIEVYLLPVEADADVTFVVYRETGGDWDLVWDSGAVQLAGGADYKQSPPVNVVLEPGETYAIGVYIGADEVGYTWGTVGDEDLGWAVVDGVLWADSGGAQSLPDTISYANGGGHHYDQRITVLVPSDLDADGANELVDCDDSDPSRHPSAEELCNGLDDDCDDDVDEGVTSTDWYADGDGDGYGDATSLLASCNPPDGYVTDATDCNNVEPTVHPTAEEVCDGMDSNCDGSLDDGEGDTDGDGAFDCGDCAPDDPAIRPGIDDLCEGVDNNCDGVIASGSDCDAFLGEKLAVQGTCGCDTSRGAPGVILAMLWVVAGTVRRRR